MVSYRGTIANVLIAGQVSARLDQRKKQLAHGTGGQNELSALSVSLLVSYVVLSQKRY